jgi:hypothetical protein
MQESSRMLDRLARGATQASITSSAVNTLTPMEGAGFYNRHSDLQAAGMPLAFPLLEAAARTVPVDPIEPIVVVDYGASQGRNSLRPMRLAIETLRRRIGPERAIEVAHVDLPTNDFTSLFQTLSTDPDSYLAQATNVFASAVGRSYYEPIAPAGRVLLGWNAWTLHWMSRASAQPHDHAMAIFSASPAVRAAVRRQQAQDWRRFLKARASELRDGGRIVCLMMGRTEAIEGGEWVVGEFWRAVVSMGDDGLLSPDEQARITFPSAGRSVDDLRAPFGEGTFEGLALEHCSVVQAPDPFFDDYESSGDALAFAKAWSGMVRGVGGPLLAAALEPGRDAALVAGELFRRFEARLAAAPQRHLHFAARTVLRKG